MLSTSIYRAGVAAIAAVAVAALAAAHVHARDEARAVWVSRSSLATPQAVDEVVATATKDGFQTLLVPVRERGDAYFLGGIEPRPAALSSLSTFDPLADILAKGHARGLAVHAWINVNLVSGTDVPPSRAHVVYRHPEWLMVPRQIADDLAPLDPDGPEYLGRLTRFARTRSGELEGLYLSPATPASIEYTAGIVRDIVQRFAVDGVHLDYLRYPSDDFDYSRETLRVFGQNPAQFPDRWRKFRTDRLTALLNELRRAVKTARPSAIVSVAGDSDPAVASVRHLQDWNTWVSRGLLDVMWRSSADEAQPAKIAFSAPF
jgi:uncharacterized lipoprotein YddW (UPF0748 family)